MNFWLELPTCLPYPCFTSRVSVSTLLSLYSSQSISYPWLMCIYFTSSCERKDFTIHYRLFGHQWVGRESLVMMYSLGAGMEQKRIFLSIVETISYRQQSIKFKFCKASSKRELLTNFFFFFEPHLLAKYSPSIETS